MKNSRRSFLKTSGLLATGMMAVKPLSGLMAQSRNKWAGKGKIKLSFIPYTLQLRHVFTLSVSSRSTTPVVLTKLEYNGVVGYGEASMPPYLGESHASAMAFLSKVDLSRFEDPFEMEAILNYVDSIAPLNKAAKASVDIALHDLVGKLIGEPWYKIWGLSASKTPCISYTIGMDKPDVVRQKVQEASPYKILKVKLGGANDKLMIETIRSVTDKPITVDVNQGWTDKHYALDMAGWLHDKGIIFLEQAMPKEMVDENAWLTENSPIPTMGDEAVQRAEDVIKAYKVYSGINVKLMKSTGMREAMKMMTIARGLGMKLMVGCMTETSCGISAAAQLSPLVDWADLDGNLLISNDLYRGVQIKEGKIQLIDKPGIGLDVLKNVFA